MKKIYGIKVFVAFIMASGGLLAYVTPEYLFEMLVQKQGIVFEKRKDATNSKVIVVNGFEAFDEFVTKKSHEVPVVLKIYSSRSQSSDSVATVFQEVADKFNDSVLCSAIDLHAQNNDQLGKENSIIVNQKLVEAYGIQQNAPAQQVNLPVFILFRQGKPRVISLSQDVTFDASSVEVLYKAISSLLSQFPQ